MKRREFLIKTAQTPLALGLAGSYLTSCGSPVSTLSQVSSETITLPKEFRIFQFYAPFTLRDLAKLGHPSEIFYKKNVRLDYSAIRKITSRVSSSERDGAKHPDVVRVPQLFSAGEVEVSPFLNHSNPKSHIIFFSKKDLRDLMDGKNIYLATGFHQRDHFHIAMIKPEFAQGGTFEVLKSDFEQVSQGAVIESIPADEEFTGFAPGSSAG